MKNRTEKFLARFDPKDKELLEMLARFEERSMADILVLALRDYAKRRVEAKECSLKIKNPKPN